MLLGICEFHETRYTEGLNFLISKSTFVPVLLVYNRMALKAKNALLKSVYWVTTQHL